MTPAAANPAASSMSHVPKCHRCLDACPSLTCDNTSSSRPKMALTRARETTQRHSPSPCIRGWPTSSPICLLQLRGPPEFSVSTSQKNQRPNMCCSVRSQCPSHTEMEERTIQTAIHRMIRVRHNTSRKKGRVFSLTAGAMTYDRHS